MENHKDNEMRKIIEDKLGFNLKEYSRREQEALKKMKEAGQCDSYECDNIPSPLKNCRWKSWNILGSITTFWIEQNRIFAPAGKDIPWDIEKLLKSQKCLS